MKLGMLAIAGVGLLSLAKASPGGTAPVPPPAPGPIPSPIPAPVPVGHGVEILIGKYGKQSRIAALKVHNYDFTYALGSLIMFMNFQFDVDIASLQIPWEGEWVPLVSPVGDVWMDQYFPPPGKEVNLYLRIHDSTFTAYNSAFQMVNFADKVRSASVFAQVLSPSQGYMDMTRSPVFSMEIQP